MDSMVKRSPPVSQDAQQHLATQTSGEPAAALADTAVATATVGSDVDRLLTEAELALASVDWPQESGPPVKPFHFRDFSARSDTTESAGLKLIRDVELNLKIELGRRQMVWEDVRDLRKGSVVSLDKMVGDPVDVFVGGNLIARGEVLVLNERFCVRVTELIRDA
jgi:flagellar motor switch protein FliN